MCIAFFGKAEAQDDTEYRMEVGVGGGLMGYLGDFNGNLTKDLQPMGSLVGRYNFNPYLWDEAQRDVRKDERLVERCGDILSGIRGDTV